MSCQVPSASLVAMNSCVAGSSDRTKLSTIDCQVGHSAGAVKSGDLEDELVVEFIGKAEVVSLVEGAETASEASNRCLSARLCFCILFLSFFFCTFSSCVLPSLDPGADSMGTEVCSHPGRDAFFHGVSYNQGITSDGIGLRSSVVSNALCVAGVCQEAADAGLYR
jgi:hypothetical protein